MLAEENWRAPPPKRIVPVEPIAPSLPNEKRAAVDVRATLVGVRAREDERAGSRLGEAAACAAERSAVGRVLAVSADSQGNIRSGEALEVA